MASTALPALLCIKLETFLVFPEGLCGAGVANTLGEAGVLDELGRLHVAGTVGHSSMEGMYTVLQRKPQQTCHDALDGFSESGVAPAYGLE